MAAVARGVGAGPRAQQAAHEAAHVAIHLLVEGYFGAAATLSVGRAAALALTGANTWMFSQSRMDREHTMRASLAALIFAGRRVGIVNVGDCRVYRLRQGQLTPLTADHTRPLADGMTVLTRSVGGDAELHIDYSEDEPQVSDRYIVLSKGAYSGIVQLTERLVASASPDEVAESLAPAQSINDGGRDRHPSSSTSSSYQTPISTNYPPRSKTSRCAARRATARIGTALCSGGRFIGAAIRR